MNTLEPNAAHELLGDLKALAEEAGTLIQDATAGKPTADDFATLKAQFEVAQARFAELCGEAKEKAIEITEQADESIRRNPYQALAFVGGLGLVIGFLVGRRR